jgi:hypothetical protein
MRACVLALAPFVALAAFDYAAATTFTVPSTSGPAAFGGGSGFFDTGLTLMKDQALVIDASGSFFNGVATATPAGFPGAIPSTDDGPASDCVNAAGGRHRRLP